MHGWPFCSWTETTVENILLLILQNNVKSSSCAWEAPSVCFFFFWLELDTLSMREDVKDEGLRPSVNLWTKWQTGRYKPRTEAKVHFDYRCTEWFGKINFAWPWEEECCWALAIWSEATGTFSTSNLSRLGLNANLYLCCVGWCPSCHSGNKGELCLCTLWVHILGTLQVPIPFPFFNLKKWKRLKKQVKEAG